MNTSNFNKKKIAILFFGLTRSLKNVYPSLKTNIFDVLDDNNIEYDIFMHTYVLPNPYINPYVNTKIENYDNESYKLLNPKYYILENQNKAEQKLHISKYFSKLSDWAGCAKTIEQQCFFVRNMVLAQHSKKMVTKLFNEYKDNYDYVMFTRPDQELHNKINPVMFNFLDNNNIIIPKEHSYLGINDRLCIATPYIGIIYGNSFYFLLSYSEKKSIISEVFLKEYLQFNNIHIIYSPITATLIRI
jgi:hypothetical protein